MRAKTLKLVVTFYTTADAMAMEQLCSREQSPGRLIPVPRSVTSDCGIAWSCDLSLREEIERMMEADRLEPAGFYELMV